MKPRSSRPAYLSVTIGLALVATLAWSWLHFGGAVDRIASDEADRLETALAFGIERIAGRLDHPVAGALALTLDVEGRVLAPLMSPRGRSLRECLMGPTESDILAAEGLRFEMHGEDTAAVQAFRLASRPLSPRATLAEIRALARCGNDDEAKQRADAVTGRSMIAGLPLELAARLALVHLGLISPQAVWSKIAEGSSPVPADALDGVLDRLEAAGARLVEPATRDLRALAALLVEHGERGDAAWTPGPGPKGGWLALDPTTGGPRWLAPADLRALAQEVLAEATPGGGGLKLSLATSDARGDHLSEPLSPGIRLEAKLVGLPASRRLALTTAVLAVVAAVLGVIAVAQILTDARRTRILANDKEHFVDLVSHELRTPLAVMRLKTELLARGEVAPHRQRSYLQALDQETLHLSRLVENLLDFSRLTKSSRRYRTCELLVRDGLATVIRQERAAHRALGQRLVVRADRSLPSIQGNPEILNHLVRNLLENARRYAPRDSTIEIQVEAQGRGLRLNVLDRGPGVPKPDREDIFRAFRRGAGPSAVKHRGIGLGLAFVEHAATWHGGRARVRERAGGGASFEVWIPIGRSGR